MVLYKLYPIKSGLGTQTATITFMVRQNLCQKKEKAKFK